jgi:DNA-binding XRE family transcriptional regulator
MIHVELKDIRKNLLLSQQDLTNRLGIPKRTIEDWEGGRRTPPPWTMKLVTEKLLEIKDERIRLYTVLAEHYARWTMIHEHPTPFEESVGADKKAVICLNLLYDITSDIEGYNVNPIQALERLQGHPVEPYTPGDMPSRKGFKEENESNT